MKLERESKSQHAIRLAAKELFWKYGIEKVRVEEICSTAEVSKMTFYRNFDNKIQIAERVLDVHFQEQMGIYRNLMDSDLPFNEKIAKLIAHKKDQSASVSREFINDILHAEDAHLREFVTEFRQKSQSEFYADMCKAQNEGWIRPDIKIEFFAYLIEMLQNELSNDHFANLFDDMQDASTEISSLLFYGIMTPEKKNT